MDKKKFFDTVRAKLFNGKLTQSQVDGLDTMIDGWQILYPSNSMSMLAYVMATTFHETGRTMQPIEEWGKGKGRPYGGKLKMSRTPYTTPDKLYYGRGYVQLTWFENYEKAGKRLNVDLLNYPEKALEPAIAVQILMIGMMEGWFTGVSLQKYFNATTSDWVNARRIVNGTDKANEIANYAKIFYEALT